MTGEQEHATSMRAARWMLLGAGVVGIVMVSLPTYLALARDGGTSAWVMAAVWFVGVALIIGSGLQSLARR